MLTSTVRATAVARSAAVVKSAKPSGPITQQTRNFAVNPNEIAKRIASTKSIEKITKSMKMVSAAKLRGDTQRLMDGRPFVALFDSVITPAPVADGEEAAPAAKDPLLVLVSSDRGLCGGVNSAVSKLAKITIDDLKKTDNAATVMVVGDKGSSQMGRSHGSDMTLTIDEVWKNPMNFTKACNVAQRALILGETAEATKIVYNEFRSAIAYEPTIAEVPNFPVLAQGVDDLGKEELPHPLNQYEIEPDVPADFMQNFYEFTLACKLYGCCVENATSEQSARMTAMDNASKNASEMVESLTVLYNRARQARITTELIEIISGAESLNG